MWDYSEYFLSSLLNLSCVYHGGPANRTDNPLKIWGHKYKILKTAIVKNVVLVTIESNYFAARMITLLFLIIFTLFATGIFYVNLPLFVLRQIFLGAHFYEIHAYGAYFVLLFLSICISWRRLRVSRLSHLNWFLVLFLLVSELTFKWARTGSWIIHFGT